MRLGFNLPQIGPAATLDARVQAAQRAEELGYDSMAMATRIGFEPTISALTESKSKAKHPYPRNACID